MEGAAAGAECSTAPQKAGNSDFFPLDPAPRNSHHKTRRRRFIAPKHGREKLTIITTLPRHPLQIIESSYVRTYEMHHLRTNNRVAEGRGGGCIRNII